MHRPHAQGADPVAAAHEHGGAHVRPGPRGGVRVLSAADPALVRALDVDHETWSTDDPALLAIRERSGRGRLAVLVVDAALRAWWDQRRATDPERAAAALAALVARALAEARPGERHLVLDAGRLTPSTRATPPAVRDTAPASAGRWVAYVPRERDGSADPS